MKNGYMRIGITVPKQAGQNLFVALRNGTNRKFSQKFIPSYNF